MTFSGHEELVREYLEDSREFLEIFEDLIIRIERDLDQGFDQESVADALGVLHTFKGNSGMMGFKTIQTYVHRLEDLFKHVQSGQIYPESEVADFLFHAVDAIRRAVDSILPESPASPPMDEEYGALDEFILNAAESPSPAKTGKGPGRGRDAGLFSRKSDVLRVDFKRLDGILDLVGELVIHRTRLGRIDHEIKETLGEKGLVLELGDAVERIGKVTTELHEAVMKARMLPIRQVFTRFPRFVRDLSQDSGKDISLKIEGEDTELDKSVIDEIGDPLLHLVRNAVDHGIETPEERLQAGKPERGLLGIKAFQESNHIIISVEDDGKGVDYEALARKALEAGILTAEELERKSNSDLIFIPGLSSSAGVTEISGRGVGMDVVKNSLASINGQIEVQSEKGFGTRFVIKLPLTLAIVNALLVRVQEELYAVPLTGVIESFRLESEKIHYVNHREVVTLREGVLPLVRMDEALGMVSAFGENKYVVVVESAKGRAGLVVDSLVGQQEIVIKALDEYLGESLGVAGATVLGDGKVILIVDVPRLIEMGRRGIDKEGVAEIRNA